MGSTLWNSLVTKALSLNLLSVGQGGRLAQQQKLQISEISCWTNKKCQLHSVPQSEGVDVSDSQT